MTKYIVYAIDEDHPVIDGESYRPVKKFKRENEAMMFLEDVKNLSRYGCMIIIKETGDGASSVWKPDMMAWEKTEA